MNWRNFWQTEKLFKKPHFGTQHLLAGVVIVVSVAVSLVALEIYLTKINYPFQNCKKVFTSAELYLGQFDAETGWSYKPKISYYQGQGGFEYHFNNRGIRVATPGAQIDYRKPRLVFIGDSVTFGEELSYDQTFVAQVNHLLGDRFEVINLGVQGFGTDQSLLRLKQFIQDLEPSYVVYTFIPDHRNRNTNHDRRLHIKCFEFAGTKSVFKVKDGQLKQIAFPAEYDQVDRFKLPLFLSHTWQIWREQTWLRNETDLKLAATLVKEIQEVVKQHRAKDYYIYFDTFYDLNQDNYNNHLLNQIFSPDQQQRTLVFTNWAKDSWGKGKKYFIADDDDVHPNASLSAVIAKKFVEKFASDFAEAGF